jgi:hypothetical protein
VRAEELPGAPLLGANSVEVLDELGFGDPAIRSLIDEGIVRTAE